MKNLTKSFLAAGLATGIAVSASGQPQVILSDDFTSYGSTANLSDGSGDYTYTQIFASPFQLDTAKGFSGGQSITSGINANSENRMWINLPGGPITPTEANPVRFSFMVDIEEVLWHTREYIELRSYANGAYDDGALQDLLALGFTSSGVDTAVANARALNGPNWFNVPSLTREDLAAGNWAEMSMVVYPSTVEVYVNGVLDSTQNRGPNHALDSLVIGSGLSTAVEVWFDNVTVEIIPEPGTYAAIFGALALLGAFVYRRRRA